MLEAAIKLRESLKSLSKNEDVVLVAGMSGMIMLFFAIISIYAFWDVITACFS